MAKQFPICFIVGFDDRDCSGKSRICVRVYIQIRVTGVYGGKKKLHKYEWLAVAAARKRGAITPPQVRER